MIVIYYKTNALYEHLEKTGNQDFFFVKGNMWQLIYGNSSCEARLLVLASGVISSDLTMAMNSSEIKAYEVLKQISVLNGIGIKVIRFATDIDEIANVAVFDGANFVTISMDQLTQLFKSEGLPVSHSSTSKYLNDMTSSAYHKWQRDSLGKDLKVSDFDLWRIDRNGVALCVYELKRSYIDLVKWQPYTDDYNNFKLIKSALKGTPIEFKIAYNVRTTKPWFDDISQIKLFEVNYGSTLIKYEKICTLADFLR